MTPELAAVVEADVLEADGTFADGERRRVRRVDKRVRPGDRLHAVLHRTDILEQRGDLPEDHVRHLVEAQHQRGGDRNRPDRDRAPAPQIDAEPGNRDDEGAVHGRQRHHQPGHGAGEIEEGVDMDAEAIQHEAVLALGAGEELDRLDVGVAVDDAPRQARTRLGDGGRALAYRRHQLPDGEHVERQPHGDRRDQPEIEPTEKPHRAADIDDQRPDAVDEAAHGLAQRRAGLHHLLGDAPGEIVVEEGEALAQHVAVVLPAHHRRQAGDQRQIVEAAQEQRNHRPQHQHDEDHAGELPAMGGEEFAARRRARPVDDLAEEDVERHLDHGAGQRDEQHRQHQPAHRMDEIAIERQQPVGRALDRRQRKRVE